MNPIALFFASGDSFYAGAALLALTVVLALNLKQGWSLRVRNVAAWLSLAMIVMACPPFPWVIDVIFLVAFALWFIATNRQQHLWAGLRICSTLILLALLVILAAIELRHRRMPVLAGNRSDHLVVIGDSISSGIDARVPPWPLVLLQINGVPVKNLARPGAMTSEGLSMATQLTPEDRLIVIEIGGNDLLMGVPSDDFERALKSLLSKVSEPERTVVMFELPLLPHKIAYGQIQRRLASKYNVALIPKHCFTDAIGDASATSDGLHLSSAGARGMAALVAKILAPVLGPTPTVVSP